MPGGYAPERPEPRLEAARIGIHVLDVEAAIDVLATAGDDRDVQDALGVRERRVGIAAVADEHRVLGDDPRWLGAIHPSESLVALYFPSLDGKYVALSTQSGLLELRTRPRWLISRSMASSMLRVVMVM